MLIIQNQVKTDFEKEGYKVFNFDKSDLEDKIITWKEGEMFPGVIMVVKDYTEECN